MIDIMLSLPRFPANLLGESYYFKYLIRALIDRADATYRFTAFTAGFRGRTLQENTLAGITDSSRLIQRWFNCPNTVLDAANRHSILPADLLFGRHDLIHSFNAQPVPRSEKFILTCQDLSTLRMANGNETPELVSSVRKNLLRLTRQCRALITISEFSKREIVDLLDVPENKIVVIPNGVDREIFRVMHPGELGAVQRTTARLGLTAPYLLYMGGSSKRKNLPMLIKAHAYLCERYKIRQSLVLIGGQRLSPESEEELERSPVRDLVVRLGYLPQKDVLHVLKSATAVVCPSTYEGFGLPALEAMACGVPVILSNAASLPEVGGSAATYFEPSDCVDMAKAMYELLTDTSSRADRVNAGLQQSYRFDWGTNADQTISLYKAVLTNSKFGRKLSVAAH